MDEVLSMLPFIQIPLDLVTYGESFLRMVPVSKTNSDPRTCPFVRRVQVGPESSLRDPSTSTPSGRYLSPGSTQDTPGLGPSRTPVGLVPVPVSVLVGRPVGFSSLPHPLRSE